MGICPSSPVPRKTTTANSAEGRRFGWWGPTVKVVHVDGKLREYGHGARAAAVEAGNPGYYLCCSEGMHVGERAPRVPDSEELQPGQIYFLLPVAKSRHLLSLQDLCELAVTASDALRRLADVSVVLVEEKKEMVVAPVVALK